MGPSPLEILEILDQIIGLAIETATSHQFLETGQHPLDLLPERPSTTFPSTAGAAYLRVCKLWRVSGSRSLYRTVILSRHDQVVSLANALRQNQNPELRLGGYIRVLVLYNDIKFDDNFEMIFKYAGSIETLSISINIDKKHGEYIEGLLDVLPSMSPRELILRDLPRDTERSVEIFRGITPPGTPGCAQIREPRGVERMLIEQICTCIRDDWKDLAVLRMAIPALPRDSSRHSQIYDALPYAPHLTDIHLRKSAVIPVGLGIFPAHHLAPPMTVKYLTTLPHLQRISLQCQHCSLPPEYLDDVHPEDKEEYAFTEWTLSGRT
ncbi:hypothetical protein R3P38DRAFT_3206278 [Favolaschia claudopus]|uniref:Uncharacterized protein n=1 Tax=Favolaschia claudopus TaxID=2862362 RepID=A0AAW0AKW6_9AGAR